MIEQGIRAILLADSDVLALVKTRIYPGVLPQNPTYPCVTIWPITQDDNVTLRAIPDLKWSRLQVDSWAATYAAMMALNEKVFTALANRTGTPTGYDVRSIVPLVGGRYVYEDSIDKHRRSRDFGIWWKTT